MTKLIPDKLNCVSQSSLPNSPNFYQLQNTLRVWCTRSMYSDNPPPVP